MADVKTVRVEMDLSGLDGIDDELRDVLGQVVQQTARDIESLAKASMEGAKSGRVYRKSKGVTHQASAPGEAPARDVGAMSAGIQASPTGPLEWEVDSFAEQSYVLEFGGKHVAPRPFLTPAAETAAVGFEAAIASVIKRKLES